MSQEVLPSPHPAAQSEHHREAAPIKLSCAQELPGGLDKTRILIQQVWSGGLRFHFPNKFPRCRWYLDHRGGGKRELGRRGSWFLRPLVVKTSLAAPGGEELMLQAASIRFNFKSISRFFPRAWPLTSSFQRCNSLCANLPGLLTYKTVK